VLVLVVAFVTFLPCLRAGFVYDDRENVVENHAYRGLGGAQLEWMFTTFHMGHYQPLSWISLGLDYLIWGLNPLGYHLTNVLLHAVNSVLVMLLAARLLRQNPASKVSRGVVAGATLAALVFAVHPLRVESVAWVTERRDVLSSFFLLSCVLAYLRAHQNPPDASRRRWQFAVLGLYALSLLSRAMGATLPIILLLLDWYPLRRFGHRPASPRTEGSRAVLLEKIPFFALAAGAAVLAPIAQREVGATISLTDHGFVERLAQACYGLVFYVVHSVAPIGLSPIYVLDLPLNPWRAKYVLSALGLASVLMGWLVIRRGRPWLCAALSAYVILLLPVLGFFQSGRQEVADRYSYLPSIVWSIVIGAGLARLWEDRARRTSATIAAGAAILAVAGLATLTARQCKVWQSDLALWRHAVQRGEANFISRYSLGCVLAQGGDEQAAIEQFQAALVLNPAHVKSLYNLGNALSVTDRREEAVETYRRAIEIEPANGRVCYELGRVLGELGRSDKAAAAYREAIRLLPDDPRPRVNLGIILASWGEAERAMALYREAIAVRPDQKDAHYNLGNSLAGLGRFQEAESEYRRAIESHPGFADARVNLGVVLLRQGRAEEARRQFEAALRIDPAHAKSRANLDALPSGHGKR